MKKISLLFSLGIIATIVICSCNKQSANSTTKQSPPAFQTNGQLNSQFKLTRHQNKVAWTDLAAGLASAELGPVSFLIAGCASMAAHYDSPVTVNPNPDPDPANETDQLGYDHNRFCRAYLAAHTSLNYTDIISTAKQIRPDLSTQIDAISEETINNTIEYVSQFDFLNSSSQVTILNSVMTLSSDDINSFKNAIDAINDGNEEDVNNNVTALQNEIANYNTSDLNKERLINAFSILKYSNFIWQ